MQFDKIQAYMEGPQVVLLQPDQPPRLMHDADGRLQPATGSNPELVEKAVAHALYAQMAYRDRLHR